MHAPHHLCREDGRAFLPQEFLDQLKTLGDVREFRAGEILIKEGDVATHLYVLLSGKLKVFAGQPKKRELIYNTLSPGEYFGELAFDGGPRSASVQALQDSRCLALTSEALRGLVQTQPEFALHLIGKLMRLLRHSTQKLKSIALDDVRSRVLRLIEDEAIDEGGIRHLPKSFTQRDIANRIGATREMVNHVLQSLIRGGAMAKDAHYGLVLKNPPGPSNDG